MAPDNGNGGDSGLLRVLSLPLIVFYGLGNILGAGIYVLVGKVIGYSGYYAALAFLGAGIIAALTAFSYAELSSRYPDSSGAALYVQRGLGIRFLSVVIGILIIFVGVTSAATMTRGFVGYLAVLVAMPEWLVILLLNGVLGGLAAWGIAQSVRAAAAFTLLEVAGLVLIIVTGAEYFQFLPEQAGRYWPPLEAEAWKGVILGAFLAFYAFLGFEDMVHVAEEVRDVRRNMPRAIMLSLFVAAALYIVVALVCLLVVPPGELADTGAPLAEVYVRAGGGSPYLISLISLFAVVNGALIQIIMSSRTCYGMSRQGWLPGWLSRVNPATRTPVIATVLVTILIILLAIAFPIETLARGTSFFLLIIFALVNLALLRLKLRGAGTEAEEGFRVPLLIPLFGFLTCVGLLAGEMLLG